MSVDLNIYHSISFSLKKEEIVKKTGLDTLQYPFFSTWYVALAIIFPGLLLVYSPFVSNGSGHRVNRIPTLLASIQCTDFSVSIHLEFSLIPSQFELDGHL